ncbi:hypothetical protein [Rhodococcus sp. RDE2]|uniref:hypothetical protein n=1 Tax=Rhodococcus sp. RDE2 TaxID=2885078 RepID=UPI001E5A4421|nr:hypothetical protein [Rhodococcus sp. RDE2]BDB63547.1 hypothetical protein RDE2_53410 [Rhodococcus sp. RDE2]
MTEHPHETHLRENNPDYFAHLEKLAAENREKNENAGNIEAMRGLLRSHGILN